MCFSATASFTAGAALVAVGILAFVLAVAAYEVSAQTFVSVWCFFAAVLSALILIHFSGSMRADRQRSGRSEVLA